MTSIEPVAKVVRQHQLCYITSDELSNRLLDILANDPNLPIGDAENVASMIPEPERKSLISKMDECLAIGLERGWTHHWRLQAWAAALRRLWTVDTA